MVKFPLVFLTIALLPLPMVPAAPLEEDQLKAVAAILVDARTGEELYARSAATPRAVASTQKLLLALMVAELGDLDTPVKITGSDVKVTGSRLGLQQGETYTRRELLHALLVKSANDVANTLAREAGGGDDFAYPAAANKRAQALGCEDTRIRNAHGLTVEGQYSTAQDLAKIARAVYMLPDLRAMVATQELKFTLKSGEVVELKNTNRLLAQMPASNGMKTGYTRASGHCLVASASAGGTDLIAVVLGSTEDRVIGDARLLLEWGFAERGVDLASPTP